MPAPTFVVAGIPLDATGAVSLSFAWGGGLPTGTSVFTQFWTQDASGPAGFSSSNGLSATGP